MYRYVLLSLFISLDLYFGEKYCLYINMKSKEFLEMCYQCMYMHVMKG